MHSRSAKSVGALPKSIEFSPTTTKFDKRGKFGVTVPQPFQFDIRDKVRPKTIREQKIDEMVEQKRVEEQVGHTFRCKPIPAHVLKPRYEQIMTANEKRRQKVKMECLEITK